MAVPATVTLVLKKHRIYVSREDLISNSEYFASLLSPNFKDCDKLEHIINYDIDVDTLRTFIKWASDPSASVIGDHRHVKPSLAKYVKKPANFDDLLQLLELSVLFASEPLIKDLTDLIACHYLIPQKSVRIWLLARELGLTTLAELGKATCIDRFGELPIASLLNLSGEDFIMLVGNVHIKVRNVVSLYRIEQWIEHNVPPGETNPFGSRYPFTLISKDISITSNFEEMFVNQQRNHNMQCIVGCKQTPDNGVKKCVYGWDGDTFSEIIELSSSPIASVDDIDGIKVLGRGFDIYLFGGEYGRGSGNLQTEIWRYSTISKTWYYVTSMPRPRPHNAVIFVDEKLYLIGGVEQSDHKRSLVDVYNVHTGNWRKLPAVPEIITDEALIFRVHDSVTVYNWPEGYWYLTDEEKWESDGYSWFRSVESNGKWDFLDPFFLMSHGTSMYILGSTHEDRPIRKIFWLESIKTLHSHLIGNCLTTFDNQVNDGPFLTGFSHENRIMFVEVMKIHSNRSLETKIVYKEVRNDIKDLCPMERISCFNLIDPKSLNELCVFENKAE